jgi:type III pantothenate kinase
MVPDIVVDVGNSRIKWGRCEAGTVSDFAGLPHNQPDAWEEQLRRWGFADRVTWVVCGVQLRTRDRLVEWLGRRADEVVTLESARSLPLRTRLEQPDKAGIDRLLNAVAVNARRRPASAAVIIDAGSAVTVDLVDTGGVFCGGAIFPGFRLMAQALHQETALLPLIDSWAPDPAVPATATRPAMAAGIYWAVAGGIRALVDRYDSQAGLTLDVYLAGGDAVLLEPALKGRAIVWPTMTLEGIRLAAEALP